MHAIITSRLAGLVTHTAGANRNNLQRSQLVMCTLSLKHLISHTQNPASKADVIYYIFFFQKNSLYVILGFYIQSFSQGAYTQIANQIASDKLSRSVYDILYFRPSKVMS